MAQLADKLVLYGGGAAVDETWEWDGNTWTQRLVKGPNSGGRSGHTMATLGNKIVLFGGYTVTGGVQSYPQDTWEWDGNGWAQRSTTGPAGSASARMAAR